MKTLEELNQKPWYRFFKVVYVVMWLPYLLLFYVIWSVSALGDAIKGCLIMTIVYVLFAEGIRRAFYYILLGRLFPRQR